MRSSGILALAAAIAPAVAYTGFNYGTTHTDGSAKTEQDFANEFALAKNLAGTNGQFTSARLYTCIQAGTVNTPVAAFAAAAKEGVSLLLGMWASSGSTTITNEIAALKSALAANPNLAKSVAGISVGSEDLYRNSDIGIKSKAGIGENPAVVANYIKQVKSAFASTSLGKVPVGHVDTWTAWVNGSNQAVIDDSDFIGFDAYPYFQSTMSNPITSGKALFDDALGKTKAAAGGKPVWITETGWPVSGPNSNLAVPGLKNAKTYWDEVGCPMFGSENVWWYTVQDADPGTPSPSFGLVAAGGSADKPLYDLSCKDISSATDSAPSSKSTKAPKDSNSGSSSDSSSEESSTSTVGSGEGSPGLGHAGSTGTITGVPGPTGTGSAGGSGGNSTFTVGTATASPTAPAGTSSGTVPSGAAVALAGNAPVVGSIMGLAMALMAVL